MKKIGKITAILCATVLATGVCAACACGSGGQSGIHKPEIPAGVDKINVEEMNSSLLRDLTESYDKFFARSDNRTCDVYQLEESTNIEDGITRYGVNEGTRNVKYFDNQDNRLGDDDYDVTMQAYSVENGQTEKSNVYKNNYVVENRLRGDVYYEKDTDGEHTEDGITTSLAGLKTYRQGRDPSPYSIFTWSPYILYDVLLAYLTYIAEGEYYYPDGDIFGTPVPKSTVKTFEVDLRTSGSKLYFSYCLEREYKDETTHTVISTDKNVYTVSADYLAGLKESDFGSAQITEKDVKDVLYLDTDIEEMLAELTAGNDYELTPIGGGDLEKLECEIYSYNFEIYAPAEIIDGKLIIKASDFEGIDAVMFRGTVYLSANYDRYGSAECITSIEFNLN